MNAMIVNMPEDFVSFLLECGSGDSNLKCVGILLISLRGANF